jgi:hypothetical protein
MGRESARRFDCHPRLLPEAGSCLAEGAAIRGQAEAPIRVSACSNGATREGVRGTKGRVRFCFIQRFPGEDASLAETNGDKMSVRSSISLTIDDIIDIQSPVRNPGNDQLNSAGSAERGEAK